MNNVLATKYLNCIRCSTANSENIEAFLLVRRKTFVSNAETFVKDITRIVKKCQIGNKSKRQCQQIINRGQRSFKRQTRNGRA